MIVKLYTTTSEDNALDKELTLVREVDINLLSQTSQIDFDITLSGDKVDANYMEVPSWGKYYFLREPNILRKGYTSYRAVEDVLATYRAEIRNQTGIIARQENKANLYISDPSFPVENRNRIFFKKFPHSFENGLSYYLTIGG